MSSASPAAPPTPQEINRKLSLHSTRPTKLPKAPQSESDSESIQLPDHVQPSPRTPGPSGILSSPSATHPLSAIAEGKDQSGDEDSEEDDAEGEARQRQLTLAGGLSETVIKSGYLWKKGERRKTWKKRWFVLRSSHLAYYKTDAEYRLLRLLDLSDVHSCLTVTLKKHDNSFGIVAPSRTFYLQAHDQRDAQAWVTAINEQCEKNNQASSLRSSLIDVSGGAGGTTPAPPMITSPSDTTIQAVGGGGAAPPASGGAQPIPIPTRGHVPPPISASAYSPGYGVTSSDSEDASVSPNRSTTVDGRSRSYSRSSAAVPPSPTWPTTVASPPRAQGPATHTEWDPTKMVLNGYLMKCGSKRRHWRKRWFVLTGEKLFYSGSHMDTKPHREIALSQILDALEYDLPSHSRSSAPSGGSHHPPASAFSPGDNTDGPGGPNGTHSFKIVTTKRTLLLCAPTEEEEIRWLSAVRALLARRTSAAAAAVASGDHTAGSEATPQYAQTPTTPGVTAPTTPGGGAGGLLKGKVVRRLSLSSGGQAPPPPPPPAAAHAPSTVGPTLASKEEEKGGR